MTFPLPSLDLTSIVHRLILGAGPSPLLLVGPDRRVVSPPPAELQPQWTELQRQQADVQSRLSGISMHDWNLLLDAVKDRLRQVVGAPTEPLPAAVLAPDMARRVQSSVLECVNALDRLQADLPQALGRDQFLKQTFPATETELMQTPADLAGTRAYVR